MDLKPLRYIVAIAEEQNLTKAAKRLFVSQSTLSLYLRKLEAELGTAPVPTFWEPSFNHSCRTALCRNSQETFKHGG